MNKNIILATLFLTGCGISDDYPRPEKFCSIKEQETLPTFTLACIKNGNPLSDEEGEDLVRQCEKTAKNIVCTNKGFVIKNKNGYIISHIIPCKQATTLEEKQICRGQ